MEIRAGFVGFGEVNTPREFIEKRCEAVAAQLTRAGVQLVRATPVADDPAGKEAARAASELAQGDFSTLIVCVAGWIPSWAVFAVIEPFKHKPMILLGLTGWSEADRFITTADQAGTTALRWPMAEMGYTFKYIVTPRGGALPVEPILSYVRAAHAVDQLPSLDLVFDGHTPDFIQRVMAQHYILSYGNQRPVLADFCAILGIDII